MALMFLMLYHYTLERTVSLRHKGQLTGSYQCDTRY